jgi:hypothetical protein
METTDPEVKFEKMKSFSRRWVLAPIFAMLVASALFIVEGFPYPGKMESDVFTFFMSNIHPRVFDALYLFILVLFLITLILIIWLLVDRSLKKIHVALRFALLARLGLYAWIIFFASRLMQSVYNGVLWLPEVLARNFIFAGILLGVYFYFKRKYVEKPEMMFP